MFNVLFTSDSNDSAVIALSEKNSSIVGPSVFPDFFLSSLAKENKKFISFCKVFIDENTFRSRFSWSITFQFPSFFINIVSGSSRDKPNNNVGGLVCF